MTEESVVAIYDTAAHAQAAIRDLIGDHVPASAIGQHAATKSAEGAVAPEPGFWSGLLGGEPGDDQATYDLTLAAGSTVVTVRAPSDHVARVMAVLDRHDPIDIDARTEGYGLARTAASADSPARPAAATPAAALTDASATPARPAIRTEAGIAGLMQLAEEQLAVGKRLVNRGGTRIRRFVIETPVEERVSLRDERVVVDRRPVTDGRPVADSFGETSIEMTATCEEAVVSKTAWVREEVSLRKVTEERVETVRDTARREEVEIEQVPGRDALSSEQCVDRT